MEYSSTNNHVLPQHNYSQQSNFTWYYNHVDSSLNVNWGKMSGRDLTSQVNKIYNEISTWKKHFLSSIREINLAVTIQLIFTFAMHCTQGLRTASQYFSEAIKEEESQRSFLYFRTKTEPMDPGWIWSHNVRMWRNSDKAH